MNATSASAATSVREAISKKTDTLPGKQDESDDTDLTIFDGKIYETAQQAFYVKYFKGEPTHSDIQSGDAFITSEAIQSHTAFVDWFRKLPVHNWSRPLIWKDLFLAFKEVSKVDEIRWTDVQVVGQFYPATADSYLEGFLRLSKCAREVFVAQPTRLFLHAFYIRAFEIELFVFDRCGVYTCEVFNLREHPDLFLTAITRYSEMSNQALGINSFIEEDSTGKYIKLRAGQRKLERLILQSDPIVAPCKIVSMEPICYRAKRMASKTWEFVIKFKWQDKRERFEVSLLQMVAERKVWGVAQLFGFEDITSIGHLREGLDFGSPMKFSPTSQVPHQTENVSAVSESSSVLVNTGDQEGSTATSASNPVAIHGIRGYSSAVPKNIRDIPFDNQILSCIAIVPLGRPLQDFESVSELLMAFRDVVKGHKSLYQDGKILHQDVSMGNIMITESPLAGEPKGFLIDLDVSMELAKGPRRKGELIGTKPFISIGVLNGAPHTYRHDLESILYVFLTMATSCRCEDPPRDSRVCQWRIGTFDELASKKMRDMEKDQFTAITAEFHRDFIGLQGLAEQLRQILFPLRDGSLWIGTDTSIDGTNMLYHQMTNAFDEAISLDSKIGAKE